MKTFLVTGAAGFIGGALAQRLITDGHKVVTIDNLTTGFEEAIPKGVVFIKGNCQDYSVVKQFEKYDFEAIFHIAGQSSGEISFDDPVYDLQTNTQSTLLLLKLALKTGCKKFIYASTMSVYGDKPDVPVKEDTILKPKSFYGVGKVASEHYLRIYQDYGINCSALRLFNIYGPGQNMQNMRQGMVSIFVAQAITSKHVHIKGSKHRFRDFVYIDDVVEAFIAAFNKKHNGFDILNIATGVKTTIEKLMEEIIKTLPYSISITYKGSTPGDQFGITGNNNKAQDTIQWSPKKNLKEGLKEMIKWALNFKSKNVSKY
jgi:UDP-glucose 4-epimerase